MRRRSGLNPDDSAPRTPDRTQTPLYMNGCTCDLHRPHVWIAIQARGERPDVKVVARRTRTAENDHKCAARAFLTHVARAAQDPRQPRGIARVRPFARMLAPNPRRGR